MNSEPLFHLTRLALLLSPALVMAAAWIGIERRLPRRVGLRFAIVLAVGYVVGVSSAWLSWDFGARYGPTEDIRESFHSDAGRIFVPFVMPVLVPIYLALAWPFAVVAKRFQKPNEKSLTSASQG